MEFPLDVKWLFLNERLPDGINPPSELAVVSSAAFPAKTNVADFLAFRRSMEFPSVDN